MKALLIGLGRWGTNHLRLLAKSLPVELYAVDANPAALAAAEKMGVPRDHLSDRYETFADLVDAAVVVTPAQSHFPICLDLLKRGKDVFVEKPITVTPAEARELCEKAESGKRILQVGHIFRYDPGSHWLKKAFDDGEFGAVRMVRANFSGFKRPRTDTGVMMADAIHFVDFINYFLNATPVKVTAHLKDNFGRGMEDAAMLSLDYQLTGFNCWGVVEANYHLPGKFRHITIVGEKMSAECDFNISQYKIKTYANRHTVENGVIKAEEGALHSIECTPEEPLMAELRAFLDSVQHRTQPLADGWAGFHSMRVMEAAERSAAESRTVDVLSFDAKA
jgi:predicted dehydrogenase